MQRERGPPPGPLAHTTRPKLHYTKSGLVRDPEIQEGTEKDLSSPMQCPETKGAKSKSGLCIRAPPFDGFQMTHFGA